MEREKYDFARITIGMDNLLYRVLVNAWDIDDEEKYEIYENIEYLIPIEVLNITHIEASNKQLILSIEQPPKLQLKALLSHLRYAFLNFNGCIFHIIIFNYLNREEEEKLLEVIRQYKKALGDGA